MKKSYSLIITAILITASLNMQATMWSVDVGSGGTAAFAPTSFTANVGDVVMFMWVSGNHTVETTSVPPGENDFNSGPMNSSGAMYNYYITKSGWHTYHCGVHGGMMSGAFNVISPTGIISPTTDLLTSVSPNPFKEKINIKYNGIEVIEFFNILGDKVNTIKLTDPQGNLELNTDPLPGGIYFYITYKDGVIFETRKIVKVK